MWVSGVRASVVACVVSIAGPALAGEGGGWNGFYAGLSGGGIWGTESATVTTSPASYYTGNALAQSASVAAANAASGSVNFSNGYALAGGQAGFNFKAGSNLVAGIETDLMRTFGQDKAGSITNSASVTPGNNTSATVSISKRLDYIGTVRARLGLLATPSLLVYGTGGLAYGGVTSYTSFSGTNTGASFASCCGSRSFASTGGGTSSINYGWAAGVGAEWKFSQNWSFKSEYLYYDLGSQSYPVAGASAVSSGSKSTIPAGNTVYSLSSQSSISTSGSMVHAGFNYSF